MSDGDGGQLTEVLDQLEELTDRDEVAIGDIVDKLGTQSFASVMLIFTLISASPASAIPGVTATVGIIVAMLVIQLMIGKRSLWLPGILMRRRLAGRRLKTAIGWMRRPVGLAERVLKRRLPALVHRPLLLLPLTLILCLALMMPLMEVVPASGSIASAVIALFAAGYLMRDGVLVLIALCLMAAVPVAVWQFGFSG
ncbi:exopolysaccharide biosynthesis protein (plasmid) [Falsirhodobacter algicola]|uniref:Exopolysaccharide biosynthesis protein n=2 Tax=Falsirhodobacter algicola TaxID=2692330 RepID=A0A8J8SMI4_9RHOB|nr:exopolysaccharide biosynthesis protein [Falsirhodobacter algicola]